MPGYKSLNDTEFDQPITLRAAYLVMLRFLSDYLARGDAPVSDLLHSYSGLMRDRETSDPAAIYDFLAAARAVLESPGENDIKAR
jgi:hypothetical protein